MPRAVRSGTRVDTALLVVCGLAAFLLTISPLRVREDVAAGLRRSIVAPLVALQQRAEQSRAAFLTQGEKTAQRDTIAMRALTVPALEAENDRLRRLLGLAGRLDWGFIPAEALHGRGVGDEFTLTLTAGSRAGVRPFSPVVAPEGLVGMVQTTDPTMSLAILWTHPDFRASAMAADGSAFGIVAAHLGVGAERYLLELRGVPFRSSLKSGAVIVTSGLGGVYPRGIPIGTVLSEVKTAEAWARTYLLRPMVMPADVNNVMILMPKRTASGVDNVWQIAASIDSATRRVAEAGDSIARAQAAAEAQARRVALDSTQAAAAQAVGVTPGAVPLGGGAAVSPPPAAPRGPVTAPGTPVPSNPARRSTEDVQGSGAARPVTPVRPRPAPTARPTVDSAGRPIVPPPAQPPVRRDTQPVRRDTQPVRRDTTRPDTTRPDSTPSVPR